ncbi:MAG: multiheme c-type cytochrome [Leptospirillia bacterium]
MVKTSLKAAAVAALALGVVFVPKGISIYQEMEAMKAPRYETGARQGAAFCSTCHPDEYTAWATRSRHAVATRADSFLGFREKMRDSLPLKLMMGDRMCHACHGPQDSEEGVDCETCHGIAPEDVPIAQTHRDKFTPGLVVMRESAFCGKCHDLPGTDIMSVYTEWQASPAGRAGTTCQDCHMGREEGARADHGFDTAMHNVGIYEGDVAVTDIRLKFPYLHMAVENRITGHAVPVGGPTRRLVLHVRVLGPDRERLFTPVYSFGKKATLMAGLMPMELTENTQIPAGESRAVVFTLPDDLRNKAARVEVVLQFYEISDEYNGDLERAHWISAAFFTDGVDL